MINFQYLQESIDHYSRLGYQRVETPWTVTKEVSDITRPKGAKEFQLVHDDGKCLVASAEQGFLYQWIKGFLPEGHKYQSITPCFRKDHFDSFHTKYFMKNELFVPCGHPEDVEIVIDDALAFYMKWFEKEEEIVTTKTSIGWDIELYFPDTPPIELGSYGIRTYRHLVWVYGTGCAEPRLSQALETRNVQAFKKNNGLVTSHNLSA